MKLRELVGEKQLRIIIMVSISIAFFVSIYLSFGGTRWNQDIRYGTTVLSTSAIGHDGLSNFMSQEEEWTPIYNRGNAMWLPSGEDALIILDEPKLRNISEDKLDNLLDAKNVLLILPKWEAGVSSDEKWVDSVYRISLSAVDSVLKLVAPSAMVMRSSSRNAAIWNSTLGTNSPQIHFAQYIGGSNIDPIIYRGDSILLGKINERYNNLYVLSDPDLISNHGLARGNNAEVVYQVMQNLMEGLDFFVFDFHIYGLSKQPNPLDKLFQLPYSIITFFFFFLVGLLIWAGKWEDRDLINDESEYYLFRRDYLIKSGAALITSSPFSYKEVGERYFSSILRQTAMDYHAPSNLSDEQLLNWLKRMNQTQQIGIKFQKLREILNRKEFQTKQDLLDFALQMYKAKSKL